MAAAQSPPSRAGRNLAAALVVGFALFGLVVAGLVFWPPAIVILAAVLAALGATELWHALRQVGLNASVVPVAAGVAAMVLAAYAAALWQGEWQTVAFAVPGAVVIAALVWRMPGGAEGYARDVAGSLMIFGYVGVLMSFIGPIVAMPDGAARLALMFVCVVASDTGGYVLGATLGKHPLAPRISPKKTWEGMVGSVLLAAACGVVVAIFVMGRPWWFGVVFAVALVVVGTLGDLIESMVKRDVGVKDMSSVLPGHGGVMDRLDSMILALPVTWLIFSLPL